MEETTDKGILTQGDIDKLIKDKKRAIVIYEGDVYDATDFKETHPGGPKYIDDHVGKDISTLFYQYEHSRIAKRLLNEIKIGTLSSCSNGDSTSVDSDLADKEKKDKELREIIDPSKGTIANLKQTSNFQHIKLRKIFY